MWGWGWEKKNQKEVQLGHEVGDERGQNRQRGKGIRDNSLRI